MRNTRKGMRVLGGHRCFGLESMKAISGNNVSTDAWPENGDCAANVKWFDCVHLKYYCESAVKYLFNTRFWISRITPRNQCFRRHRALFWRDWKSEIKSNEAAHVAPPRFGVVMGN